MLRLIRRPLSARSVQVGGTRWARSRPMSAITRLHDDDPRMSQIVVHNQTVYLSGQVPADNSSPIQEQTQQVLDKVDTLLAEAGSDKSQLLSAQIWVKDMAHFDEMNEVRTRALASRHPPSHVHIVQSRMMRTRFFLTGGPGGGLCGCLAKGGGRRLPTTAM